MRVRLLISILFLTAVAQMLCDANPSGAADGVGQNTSASGSASGGQIVVVATAGGSGIVLGRYWRNRRHERRFVGRA